MASFRWIDEVSSVRYSEAMTKRVYIETWGCQMNVHQSERIAGLLAQAGYAPTTTIDTADVVIFNTCAVRQKAEEKVYGRIGEVMQVKKRHPVLFGFGGCIAQVRGAELMRRFPAIDFLFGTSNLADLPGIIARVASDEERITHLPPAAGTEELPVRRMSTVTAMVTITEGCSNFCSYCIVPYSRGPLRSRPPQHVLAEVRNAVAAGYPEILLLGQNVDSYGRDRHEYGDFADLLEQVARIGPRRIRFTSSHPRDMTSRVLETVARYDNICNHVHLAVQSGSNRILHAMNRGYTAADFRAIVDRARTLVPEINVTTDIIVGYPGETDADFQDTLRLIERARFGTIFVAKYSPRPGTRSARLPDDVPAAVKEARLRAVLELARTISLNLNRGFIGRTVAVLVEGRNRSGSYYGRTDDHRTVTMPDAEIAIGKIVSVRISAASSAGLTGTVDVPAEVRR